MCKNYLKLSHKNIPSYCRKIMSSYLMLTRNGNEILKAFNCRRFFVTSADEVLALVWNGIQTKEIDMCTTHEEPDIIIIQQCHGTVSNGCSICGSSI